ncbi:glyceraldehyde 3-phosphate dehydrogenase NAD-binding domain-containing protein [Escherichia coli]
MTLRKVFVILPATFYSLTNSLVEYMALKVGINGFGRIGRIVFRAAQKRSDIKESLQSTTC